MIIFEIIELILLSIIFILMVVTVSREYKKNSWKYPVDIPSKHEKYLFMLESGVIISGYATTVVSSYYPTPLWVFDQDKSGIHFEDTCGYRIFKWMEINY